ncbi:MAG: hypothetical protein OHK0032_14130 [Thermodesulfovibrionales bacterium]
MEISFIGDLDNKIRHECAICGEYKTLKYLIMDSKEDMFSVCEECRNKILEGGKYGNGRK